MNHLSPRIFCALFAVVAALLTLPGCRSDIYYQDRAVERARSFLLENARELTPEQVAYVKFNEPVLLTGVIFGESGHMDGVPGNSLHQICVTWRIPGREKLYMVYGVSGGRMALWYPERLIRKNFVRESHPVFNAIEAARKYAVNNLYYALTPRELNSVRFIYPAIVQTDFPYVLDPEGTAPQEEIDKTAAALKAKTQYSMIWYFDHRPDAVVFCGGSAPDGSGWNVNFAGWIDAGEIAKHTIRVVMKPADLDTGIVPEPPAPPAEKDKEIK
ncbi:MAG: hypothetical protein PHI35_01765 [Victivallaceae bacterium]|nr:hypothetical protein [Victivallaceae bacterium]